MLLTFSPELSPAAHAAFKAFKTDTSYLALPLIHTNGKLEPLQLLRPDNPSCSFQSALKELDAVLDSHTPLYVILRREQSLFAITYVPYLAKETQREFFLEYRSELVRQLGEEQFSFSLICKEVGEITDARSWEERGDHMRSATSRAECSNDCGACEVASHDSTGVKDLGYKKNKCRLCDRRMKNKISPEALDALKKLDSPGAAIQIVQPIFSFWQCIDSLTRNSLSTYKQKPSSYTSSKIKSSLKMFQQSFLPPSRPSPSSVTPLPASSTLSFIRQTVPPSKSA